MIRKSVLALILALSACGPTPPSEKKAEERKNSQLGIALTSEERNALGLQTAQVQTATWRAQILGYGVVIALDVVAQSEADYMAASASAAQSQAAAQRARSLVTGDEAAVSREAVEAANAKATADQAALLLARRKADAAFGLHGPWHDPVQRARIMERLASGRPALLRVTSPLGSLRHAIPTSLTIIRPGATSNSWNAREVWEAPADPALPGRGFYALVDGSDLAQNERVSASVPSGPAQEGFFVPASALVVGESESWVYLHKGNERYVRAPIDTAKTLSGGYFVPQGGRIGPDARIVTRGAGLLLSRELAPNNAGE